jgi:hypothetical protein
MENPTKAQIRAVIRKYKLTKGIWVGVTWRANAILWFQDYYQQELGKSANGTASEAAFIKMTSMMIDSDDALSTANQYIAGDRQQEVEEEKIKRELPNDPYAWVDEKIEQRKYRVKK